MREFPARAEDYPTIAQAISALVYDTASARKQTFAVFHDIRIEVDPKEIRSQAQYASELTWTFQTARKNPTILGKHAVCTNVVPDLRALASRQMHAFRSLDTSDMRAAITWLVEIAPATQCRPLWSRKRTLEVVAMIKKVLTDRQTQPVHPAVASLRSSVYRKGVQLVKSAVADLYEPGFLRPGWVTLAKEWLSKIS